MPRQLYLAQYTIYFFFSSYNISIPLSPIAQQAGQGPCWVACLLVCVFGLESEVKGKNHEGNQVNKRDVDIKHLYINQLKGLGAEGVTPRETPLAATLFPNYKGLGRHFRFFSSSASQNIQSARLSFQSSELGPGRHTRLRGEGLGGPNSDEGTDTLVLCAVCTVYYISLYGRLCRKFKNWIYFHLKSQRQRAVYASRSSSHLKSNQQKSENILQNMFVYILQAAL